MVWWSLIDVSVALIGPSLGGKALLFRCILAELGAVSAGGFYVFGLRSVAGVYVDSYRVAA